MKIDALALSVFTDEGVGIKSESFAARVGIGNAPEASGENTRKVGAVNRNAKHQATLGWAENNGYVFSQSVAVWWLHFSSGN